MSENTSKIKIGPRYVKVDNGYRPFQKETIDAIKNSQSKIIIVEAPVGSGKSYIIRNLMQNPDFFKRKPIILTYPTKILMDAQISALSKELPNVSIWPDSLPSANAINVFYYSSSSLVSYLRKQSLDFKLQKSELINEMLRDFGFLSNKSMIVTSPDVLHLLVNRKAYKGSKRIQNLLNGAYIFFDEFHLYSNLKNFPILIQNLLEGMASKIIFLSATPYQNVELEQIIEKNPSEFIDFKNSQSDNKGTVFNYPLAVEICPFNYIDLNQNLNKLMEFIPKSEKPMAIIFDSVFRLQKIKKRLEEKFSDKFKIIEWSGFKKDNVSIDEKTVVLGTSSIEVGIDMYFKTLITEVSYWTSAIQRIGRVGRKCEGKVIIFTNKNFTPHLNKEELDRDEFENMVLKEVLKDPSDKMIAGEIFRGDSYNFLIKDEESNQVHSYSEALFAMFTIDDKIEDWRLLDIKEKREVLEYMGIDKSQIEYLLLQDKIFPFWGIVKGKLKNKYTRVNAIYSENDNELCITDSDNNEYTFYDSEGSF